MHVRLPNSLSSQHCFDIHDTVALDGDTVLGVTKLAEDVCVLYPALLGVKVDFEAGAGGTHAAKVRRLEPRGMYDGAMGSDIGTEGDDLHYIIPNQHSRVGTGFGRARNEVAQPLLTACHQSCSVVQAWLHRR